MPIKKSFRIMAERLASFSKAREKSIERAKQLVTKANNSRSHPSSNKPGKPPPATPSIEITRSRRSWASVCAGAAGITLYARSENGKELCTQPWAQGLVSTLLMAADEGSMHLCLAWPIRFDSLVVLHALANIERNYARDLRGMRTLLYPGTYSSRVALHDVLVERTQLSNFCRSLWNTDRSNGHKIMAHTRSKSFEAILETLNDIRIHHPEVENPSLGEIVPAFIYEESQRAWVTASTNPLERSLKKVDKLARRRIIRENVNAEWENPSKAPGALMVLHNNTRKNAWKEALSASALRGEGKPEVMLFDATSSADQRNYRSVRRIPDFLGCAKENSYHDVGAVIITDDPKTFFVLRARLNELKLNPKTHIWAAEGDKAVLSTNALPMDWKPEQRSNAIFKIGIVDRDASQIALAFQKLAHEAGSSDSPSHKAVMDACLYVLRLSNMPAGYRDLTTESSEVGGNDFGSQRNAWSPVRLNLQTVLQSGALNNKRAEVEKTIAKAEQLIDDWNDATPMSQRLLADVEKYVIKGRESLSIVLPNVRYILLACRFLKRKLGDQWIPAEPLLDWHTMESLWKTLTKEHREKRFVFVGVNRSVLSLLVTHPDIPHGTSVLIAYKQADSMLTTLISMMGIEAFKPYRGRMGLLIQQLERRLKEVPNPLSIANLGEMKMLFRLEENNQTDVVGEQTYYKFELEGGGRSYSSGWLYRYESDDDPFFSRVAAKSVREGDLIFEMSDGLRSKLESVLNLKNDGLGSMDYPERALLKLYHGDVKNRCDRIFKSKKRSALAREIHAKMVEIDPRSAECRPGRIYYWLDLEADGDTKPHASKAAKFFKVFCKALEINDDQSEQHWNFICNARRLNQNLGRMLSARYAEILFQPESSAAYRKLSQECIKQLQQDALCCVYRVERVIPPQNKAKA